jgi:hypothetical protein
MNTTTIVRTLDSSCITYRASIIHSFQPFCLAQFLRNVGAFAAKLKDITITNLLCIYSP